MIADNFALLNASLSIAVFAVVSWLSAGHFKTGERLPRGSVVIVLLTFASLGVFLWSIWRLPADRWWTVVPYALSLGLFLWALRTTRHRDFWAAYAGDVPIALTSDGPYRFIRHPFYLSYLIYHLGNALSTYAVAPYVMLAVLVAVYVDVARREEATLRAAGNAEGYAAYCARTGMFLPRFDGLFHGGAR